MVELYFILVKNNTEIGGIIFCQKNFARSLSNLQYISTNDLLNIYDTQPVEKT
jgi:hypothetical protein